MPAPWPWNLPSRSGSDYVKQLEGIKLTPELKSLLQSCRERLESNDDENVAEARSVLQLVDPDCPVLTLACLRAMVVALDDYQKLDELVGRAGGLVFTPPPPMIQEETKEQRRFRKRMDRLRLRAEESRYQRLTNNLGSRFTPDDITGKSMSFAASIGLNMIIAPLTFGTFMYCFCGQIFEWVFPRTIQNEELVAVGIHAAAEHRSDLPKVLAGVVGGVGMLFIEMTLFVIRTYTMDKSISKKRKKKNLSPFGYTKPTAPVPPTKKLD